MCPLTFGVIFLLLSIATGQGCHPQYHAQGTFQTFPASDAPRCQIQCAKRTITCQPPVCRVRCPQDMCEQETCPQCETVCDPPVCEGAEPGACQPLCEQTACSWVCQAPPSIYRLTCEQPACLFSPAPIPSGFTVLNGNFFVVKSNKIIAKN